MNACNESQIDIPPSFMALFVDRGKTRPNAAFAVVAARYELCEDLAQLLTQAATELQFKQGISEGEVLQRCQAGLLGEGAVVTEAEATWVIGRLAELLNWTPGAS